MLRLITHYEGRGGKADPSGWQGDQKVRNAEAGKQMRCLEKVSVSPGGVSSEGGKERGRDTEHGWSVNDAKKTGKDSTLIIKGTDPEGSKREKEKNSLFFTGQPPKILSDIRRRSKKGEAYGERRASIEKNAFGYLRGMMQRGPTQRDKNTWKRALKKKDNNNPFSCLREKRNFNAGAQMVGPKKRMKGRPRRGSSG